MPQTKLEIDPRNAAATKAWFGVVRAYNLCDATMATRLAPLGLKVGEHEVLANLSLAPGMTQQALATRCFVAKSGISMLLTRMEERGWLRRKADDRDLRAKRLYLTSSGSDLALQSMAIQDEIVAAMMLPLSLQEMAAMAEQSARVSDALEKLSVT